MLFQVAQSLTPEEVKPILVVLIACGFIFILAMGLLKAGHSEAKASEPAKPPEPVPHSEPPTPTPAPAPTPEPVSAPQPSESVERVRADAERVGAEVVKRVDDLKNVASSVDSMDSEAVAVTDVLKTLKNEKLMRVFGKLVESIELVLRNLEKDVAVMSVVPKAIDEVLKEDLGRQDKFDIADRLERKAENMLHYQEVEYAKLFSKIKLNLGRFSSLLFSFKDKIEPSSFIFLLTKLRNLESRFGVVQGFFK